MRHVDMRRLPAAAQEERRRQVIGLSQGGMTHAAIAAQVGLTRTGLVCLSRCFDRKARAALRSRQTPAGAMGRKSSRSRRYRCRAIPCPRRCHVRV